MELNTNHNIAKTQEAKTLKTGEIKAETKGISGTKDLAQDKLLITVGSPLIIGLRSYNQNELEAKLSNQGIDIDQIKDWPVACNIFISDKFIENPKTKNLEPQFQISGFDAGWNKRGNRYQEHNIVISRPGEKDIKAKNVQKIEQVGEDLVITYYRDSKKSLVRTTINPNGTNYKEEVINQEAIVAGQILEKAISKRNQRIEEFNKALKQDSKTPWNVEPAAIQYDHHAPPNDISIKDYNVLPLFYGEQEVTKEGVKVQPRFYTGSFNKEGHLQVVNRRGEILTIDPEGNIKSQIPEQIVLPHSYLAESDMGNGGITATGSGLLVEQSALQRLLQCSHF